jgi:Periplasmic component of the Tol biopolymer transport system
MIADVSLYDPHGARNMGSVACDRVDAGGDLMSCMRIVRGVPTTFETLVLDPTGRTVETWALPGVPSRTRVSDNGLVATTAFVTGHSYASNSFSTETTVKSPDGRDYGNLEDFTTTVDGRKLTAIDRNVWGVTFTGRDSFYATVASGGKTWLMLGSFDTKRLTSVIENAECPSVAPDGESVAYKKRRGGIGAVHWDIAVLDLASRKETLIRLADGLDDQLEWLDNDTLLYGAPHAGEVGDSDVFSITTTANAQPQLLIEHAWSPSVQR